MSQRLHRLVRHKMGNGCRRMPSYRTNNIIILIVLVLCSSYVGLSLFPWVRELVVSRPQQVCNVASVIIPEAVAAEGVFENNVRPGRPNYSYQDLVNLLVGQRFLFAEEFSTSERAPFSQNRAYRLGPGYYRYYLSEVGDPACDALYPMMSREVFLTYRSERNVPRDLCIASERVVGPLAPYAHERIEIVADRYKGATDRLRERESGKTIAEHTNFVISRGDTRAGRRTCFDYVSDEERKKRVIASEQFARGFKPTNQFPDPVRPSSTMRFLDSRNLADDSPVRRFYQTRRSQGPAIAVVTALAPHRHVLAEVEDVVTLDRKIDAVEFGKRFRSPMETMNGAVYSRPCKLARVCLRIDLGDSLIETLVPGEAPIDWALWSGNEIVALSGIESRIHERELRRVLWIHRYRRDGTLVSSTEVALPRRDWRGRWEKPITAIEETATSYRLRITEFDNNKREPGTFLLLSEVTLLVPK